MNIKEIRELIELVRTLDLSELELERSGFRVKIKRSLPVGSPSLPGADEGFRNIPAANRGSEGGTGKGTPEKVSGDIPGLVTITSPIVGTFYRSPAPDADPYVEVGDSVKKGQILCIVEAMKLMNEIESETDGKIVDILVENAKTVEYGEPLFRIQPH